MKGRLLSASYAGTMPIRLNMTTHRRLHPLPGISHSAEQASSTFPFSERFSTMDFILVMASME